VEDTFMYNPKDYYPAICLALNYEAGGLEIFDYMYMEDHDSWYVECNDNGYHIHGFRLDGKFVRSCFKACKEGVISWIKTKKES
jgi:hypothetical protein